MPDTQATPEEKALSEQVKLAELKQKLAEAELNAAKAKKEALALNNPVSDKDKATLEKDILVAQKEALAARKEMVRGPDVKGLEGKITATGTFIESRILAGRLLTKSMQSFISALMGQPSFKKEEKIDNKGDNKVHGKSDDKSEITWVIHNPSDFAAVELFVNFMQEVEAMKEGFETHHQKAKIALEKNIDSDSKSLSAELVLAGYAAAGLLRTAADIVSLFRINTTYDNFDSPFEENTVVAAFVEAIAAAKEKWHVFYPALYPIGVVKGASASPFTTALTELKDRSAALRLQLEQLEKKRTTLQNRNDTDEEKKKKVAAHIKELEGFLQQGQSLDSAYTQFSAYLATKDTITQLTPQTLVLRAERTAGKLSQPNTYVVKFGAVAKGSTRITQSLWNSGEVYHSAGVELTVLVFAPDGEVKFANRQLVYSKYQKADEISE